MPRGRPRQFDEDAALMAAMQLFWRQGLAATSLDDLAGAMAMNRPSIYNAFGDKEAIYRRALTRFCAQMDQGLATTLGESNDLRSGLLAFFDEAIEVYCSGEQALGCLMICTAPTEAITRTDVGDDLRGLIGRLDRTLAYYLKAARDRSELSDQVDVKLAAKLLQATLQSLALRARAGESRRSLKALARYAVATITS